MSEALSGAPFSTYRIGGPLQEAYQPRSKEEAIRLLDKIYPEVAGGKKKLTVLGWGGNTIIASKGISGIVVITRKMAWVEDLGENRFLFAAGVHLAKASKVAQQHALTGAEYMIGIPGTVGGAVRMNAGAMGQETCEVVRAAEIYNLETGWVEHWTVADLQFSYRKSTIDPKRHFILEAELAFRPGDLETITASMEKSVSFRKAHHPTEPNGGSVFKNPYSKHSEKGHMTAGWMLDQLGAKEWREGGVRVSPMHANFIVNVDGGASTDVLRLMVRMKRAIKVAFNVDVHPENLFVGDATDEEKMLWKELTGEQPV